MINTDYIDAFVYGYVARDRMADWQAEADERRLIKEYRAAHPDQGWRQRTARLLRSAADRLAPTTCPRIARKSVVP